MLCPHPFMFPPPLLFAFPSSPLLPLHLLFLQLRPPLVFWFGKFLIVSGACVFFCSARCVHLLSDFPLVEQCDLRTSVPITRRPSSFDPVPVPQLSVISLSLMVNITLADVRCFCFVKSTAFRPCAENFEARNCNH